MINYRGNKMNEKILIIDDEPAICSSLTLALEDQYNVKATTSPMEGIKFWKKTTSIYVYWILK